MGRRFYGFNNRFRTTKNGEADGRDISIAKLVENTSLIIK